jgi:hypothetical protein
MSRLEASSKFHVFAILIFFCGYSSAYSGSCWKSDPIRSICPSGQYRPSYNEKGCLPCLALLILLPASLLLCMIRKNDGGPAEGIGLIFIFLITFFPCFYCSPCCSYVEPGYFFNNDINENSGCTTTFENGNLVVCGKTIYKRACSPGSYNKDYGQSACSECGIGYFSDGAGATICQGCPTGKVSGAYGQIGTGSTACFSCPAGTFAGIF